MNTYIFRTIATILGVPMVAFFLLKAFGWYENMTEDNSLPPLSAERIQFPLHHPWARGSLNRFNALQPAEQKAVRDLVEGSIQDLDDWLGELNKQDISLLCLGENHDGNLRRLIAERVLPYFPTDVLMLEGDRTDAARIVRHSESRAYAPLLGVDMTQIVRASKQANPNVRILGIEETRAQFKGRKGGDGSARDRSIEKNLRQVYQPGKRHTILYGAFHCSHKNAKFYSKLVKAPPSPTGRKMLNVRVAHEHIEAPIEAFIWFLDELGFAKRDIVITDTNAIATQFREWFPFFTSNELGHFSAMIIMRPTLGLSDETNASGS